jgi:hypothetical protein
MRILSYLFSLCLLCYYFFIIIALILKPDATAAGREWVTSFQRVVFEITSWDYIPRTATTAGGGMMPTSAKSKSSTK